MKNKREDWLDENMTEFGCIRHGRTISYEGKPCCFLGDEIRHNAYIFKTSKILPELPPPSQPVPIK